MTIVEFRKEIAESSSPDVFNTLQWDLKLPHLKFINRIEGLTAIYEFNNQQVDGWNHLGEQIPPELVVSRESFGQYFAHSIFGYDSLKSQLLLCPTG